MKMTKKVLSVLLSLMLVLCAVAVGGMTASADSTVYEISSYSQLKDFADLVNSGNTSACAKLMKDIECKYDPDDTEYATDWTPIGMDYNHIYIGTFDGNGRVIIGLSNSGVTDAPNYAGLFGYVGSKTEGGVTTKGTVKNVGLEGGSITGTFHVGGVVGLIADNGTVTNCCNTGDVSGNDYVGGVAGEIADNGTVTNCYNTGEVYGSDFVGGVVGYDSNNSSVENCYNTGTVSGGEYVGGVVGYNKSTTSNCYNTGNVLSSGTRVGGIAGMIEGINGNTAAIKNCYIDSDRVTGVDIIGGKYGEGAIDTNVSGLTTAQMTGRNAISYDHEDIDIHPMYFNYDDAESPWLTKADGADEASGKYYWYYPQLKGFNKKADGTPVTDPSKILPSDWPAKAEVTAALSEYSFGYDGLPHITTVTSVKVGGKTLEQGSDYTVKYYKNLEDGWSSESVDPVDAGEYKAVVKFTADGHSEIEKEFKITPKSLSDASISIDNIPDVTYDGSPQTPQVTIKDGDTELVENADYSLSYSDNVNVSRDGSGNVIAGAIATVSGRGNYTGSADKEFTVTPASVILEGGSRSTDIYDGTEKTLTGFTSSVPGLTFEGVTASGSGIESGPHDVTFSGVTVNETTDTTGNYIVTGVFNGTLNINPVDTNVTVTIKGNSETADYDGSEHSAAGYTFETSNPLYKESDFIFSGTDVAERAEPGTENMGLAENQFANISRNFTNVTFVIAEDGKLTVNPVIRFVNEDGTELQSGAVAYGETPEYTGETPVKEEKDGYAFDFKGWTPEITAATDNATYTATFTKTAITYTATFVGENGETVAEIPYTVETESIEAPAVPEKQGYAGEWEEYTLEIGGITVRPFYTGNTSIELEGYTDSIEIGYKEDKTFTVKAENLPEGAEVHWFVNGEDVGTGESYTVEDPTEDYNIYAAVVDADGNTLDETQVQAVKVRNGFLDKLKWFFSDFWTNIFKAIIDALIKVC